jgi:hypothetical protein
MPWKTKALDTNTTFTDGKTVCLEAPHRGVLSLAPFLARTASRPSPVSGRGADGRPLSGGCADYFFHSFSRWYVPLPAGGAELHIRINNPQRLKWLTFAAYTGFKPYPWDKSVGVPFGERHLDYTIRRVQRDGKTVAWNVFFRLPRAESHYYLDLYTQWKPAPDAGLSFYDTWYTFHVRTF